MALFVGDQDDQGGRWVDRAPEWHARDLTADEIYRLRCLLAGFLRKKRFRARQIAQIFYPDREPRIARVQVHRMLDELDSVLDDPALDALLGYAEQDDSLDAESGDDMVVAADDPLDAEGDFP